MYLTPSYYNVDGREYSKYFPWHIAHKLDANYTGAEPGSNFNLIISVVLLSNTL